ncbi:MAG: LptF/LptG family permease [Anaeromyxobacter sp.]
MAKEILQPLGAGLLFLTQLMLATAILGRAQLLFGSGVSLGDVGMAIVTLLPAFIVQVLPIAFLLGAVLGVGRLAEDREIVAMGAAGLSPARLVRVPLILALLAGALGVWMSLQLEPWGLRASRLRMNDIVKQNVARGVRPGVFYDDIPGYTLFAERVTDAGRWENVLIHDRSNPDAPVLALSRHGGLAPIGAGQEMRLELVDGEVHRGEGEADDYAVPEFERASLVVSIGPQDGLGRSSREQTVGQLRAAMAEARARNDEKQAWRLDGYLHRKIASALAVIAFALLAVPLGASRFAGRAFGVGSTFVVMLLHYLLLRSGETLVQAGRLPGWIGLELSNLVLGGAGLVLLALLARRGVGAVR